MDEDVRRIVAESLKGELRSLDFYFALAERTSNEEIKKLCHRFAAEEEGHLRALVDWLEEDTSPEVRSALREVRLLLDAERGREKASPLEAEQISEPGRLLLAAIAKETESIASLRALQERVDDPGARGLLARIMGEEERHKAILERRYEEAVKRSPSVVS